MAICLKLTQFCQLSFDSQSNAGLENCRPPTLDIVQISQRFNNNNNSKNTNYLEENRLNMLSFIHAFAFHLIMINQTF